MTAENTVLTKRKPTASSRITNGSVMLAEIDGRSTWARRYRDLVALHAEDMGGMETLSQAQLALIRRAATIEVELERREAILANGGSVDLDEFNRAAGGLRRLLESVGLERKPRDVTPTLQDIIRQHESAQNDEHAGAAK